MSLGLIRTLPQYLLILMLVLMLVLMHGPVVRADINKDQQILAHDILLLQKPVIIGRLVRVVDGDTVKLKTVLSPGIAGVSSFRPYDVDTPEISRAKCQKERQLGLAAKKFVEELLENITYLKVENIKHGTFARRYIADIYYKQNGKWINLKDTLLNSGIGLPYDGKKHPDWC